MDDRSGDEEFDVYIIELQNRFGYLRKSMMDRLKEKEKETKKETRNNREYFPQEILKIMKRINFSLLLPGYSRISLLSIFKNQLFMN